MNSELLDKAFELGYPEELDGVLDISSAHAIVCKFNRLGTLIAIGGNDGRVFLFDFITRGLVKSWGAHVKPICSIDWSRSGRLLLTASADSSVAIWNVLDTSVYVDCFHNGACVNPPIAMFNPRNENHFLVLTLSTPTTNGTIVTLKNIETGEEIKLDHDISQQSDEAVTAISFDRRGVYAFLGTAKGRIIMYDAKTTKYVKTVHQGGVQQIKDFWVTRRGGYMMTNSVDRIVRCFRFDQFRDAQNGSVVEPIQRFQDMVNKTQWKSICGSNEGDYVCGASAKGHSLHIWERNSGNLIKILHGAKGEMLTDAQWHPFRPVILSISSGTVSVWTRAHVENWSAFAPDFTELDENRRYEEREFEFDVRDQDAEEEVRVSEEVEEELIDVVGLQSHDLGSSDEEDANIKDLVWFLPITTEVEGADEPIVYEPHAA
ncbi:hypothetical protein M3Y94_01136400 [Aphelenchoides besseyi]|nr:hypothetical protein M3Y94_01136400 [Aphelenchoides besseyi]KAI6227822.1 WD domain, G-beta repeat protein [Aphelenchoides besseyi]